VARSILWRANPSLRRLHRGESHMAENTWTSLTWATIAVAAACAGLLIAVGGWA
jgi:hypothetical protein